MADVKRPIGAKLVIIITILLLISLGAITVLVSVMVSSDVRVTAEDNNLTANRRSASEAEITLGMIRSNTLVLLETLTSTYGGASGGGAASRQAAALFFERNRDVALVAILGLSTEPQSGEGSPLDLSAASPRPSTYLVNDQFFLSNELEPELADAYIAASGEEAERAANGEILILNAMPALGIPALAMFYPWQEGGFREAAAVIFSPDSLSDFLGTGTNLSWIINGDGDVLVHPDYEMVRAGVNAASQPFVSFLRESPEQSLQTLYREEDGTRRFGAFTKLSLGDAAVITTIDYDLVFEGINATTRRNIFLAIIVLSLAILFIWFFSKTISNPLKALSAAANRIEGGDFDIKLEGQKEAEKDEIGALTDSFGKMSRALSIFGRFTNREIAVRAMRGEIKPGGLPKMGTIFFSDIRGFTAHSEKITLEYGEGASDQIVAWLNDYFTRMVECVDASGGVVDKFIGDAVMAHWGTAYSTGSPEADALACVKAALAMRKALWEMNAGRGENERGFPKIKIGCGINTGLVTAGQIGSDKRMEYTVIGDPVNLASRTEALNKPMGTDILITENTWELVRDELITEEMPSVTVKGKEEPVRLFAVINLKDHNGESGTSAFPEPETLAELRSLLGIEAPDLSKVDTGSEEKKYKIGEG
jgi:adenylate cyclase